MRIHRSGFSRRAFGLGALGAALTAFATGASGPSARRLIVVHAEGGWDPLVAFAPKFDAPLVQLEPEAAPITVGGFDLVDGPDRPAVVSFFRTWGNRTLLINGLSTRSVNHEVCQVVAMTGTTSDNASDWGTLLALANEADYPLPHLVFGGPIFAGSHTGIVASARGKVGETVSGEILENADTAVVAPASVARDIVDAHLERRLAGAGIPPGGVVLRDSYGASAARARNLASMRDRVDFPGTYDLRSSADVAVRAIADGLCRVATVGTDFVWDTHGDNYPQLGLFQSLFADLDHLMRRLGETTTADGVVLADVTDVLVVSEMGRTPAYNGTNGRDHWPFTSALLIGAGITGGRTIGGYADNYTGIGVDPASGELDPSRPGIDARALGATLLALGGVDPGEHMQSPELIEAVLT